MVTRNILLDEERILSLLDFWRDIIAAFLMDRKPIELSTLGAANPRPKDVPLSIRLKDVLLADSRFQLSGEGTDIKVKLRLEDTEITRLVCEWKDSIYGFLLGKNRCVNMSEIGGNAPKPPQLPSNVRLLVETLRADTTGRLVTNFG